MPNKVLSYQQRSALATHPVARRLFALMESKKTNLSLSADMVKAADILRLVDQVGSSICVLKTHVDIIEDFTPAFTQELRSLADRHQFLIFEDRKFADIGHTVQLQYQHGVYHIADWADIINAHPLLGPGIIDGLKAIGEPKQRGLLLLAQLSSQGNLVTPEYVRQTVAMAERYPNFVMGFISQQRISNNPTLIHMTPGVQMTVAGDALGQQYRTPEQAIVEQGCDVMIVGRGILQAKDPIAVAEQYRQAGWQAYQKTLQTV